MLRPMTGVTSELQVIDLIHEHHGDVIKFAGDSMIVAFCPTAKEAATPDGGIAACASRCARCGLQLVSRLSNMRMRKDGTVVRVEPESEAGQDSHETHTGRASAVFHTSHHRGPSPTTSDRCSTCGAGDLQDAVHRSGSNITAKRTGSGLSDAGPGKALHKASVSAVDTTHASPTGEMSTSPNASTTAAEPASSTADNTAAATPAADSDSAAASSSNVASKIWNLWRSKVQANSNTTQTATTASRTSSEFSSRLHVDVRGSSVTGRSFISSRPGSTSAQGTPIDKNLNQSVKRRSSISHPPSSTSSPARPELFQLGARQITAFDSMMASPPPITSSAGKRKGTGLDSPLETVLATPPPLLSAHGKHAAASIDVGSELRSPLLVRVRSQDVSLPAALLGDALASPTGHGSDDITSLESPKWSAGDLSQLPSLHSAGPCAEGREDSTSNTGHDAADSTGNVEEPLYWTETQAQQGLMTNFKSKLAGIWTGRKPPSEAVPAEHSPTPLETRYGRQGPRSSTT